MKIRIGFEIAFECVAPTPAILMLSVHPSRSQDLETPATMIFDPDIQARNFTDRFGNIGTRIIAPAGILQVSSETVVYDSGLPDPVLPDAEQLPADHLPHEALEFLVGSRYCEVDRLSDIFAIVSTTA